MCMAMIVTIRNTEILKLGIILHVFDGFRFLI